jgi:hypothetical protein
MGILTTVRAVTPELLAVAWLPGSTALCVLSVGDTYTGLLDPPLPPTSWTWTLLVLYMAWTLGVPVLGLTISLRRRETGLVLLHGALLVGACGLCYAGYDFIL